MARRKIKPHKPLMENEMLSALVAALTLIFIGSFCAIPFKRTRRIAGWIAAASFLGMMVISPIVYKQQEELNQSAVQAGFQSADDMRAAAEAGISNPTAWAPMRAKIEARKAQERADYEAKVAKREKEEEEARKKANRPASLADAATTQWSYHQMDDAMGKGAIYQAQVSSSNTVDFAFPYAGAQHATLTLRINPRYGKDVIFSIEKGQFLCHSYEDCTVLVRFDDEQAIKYTAIGAADNSTETIFIRNYDRFVAKMLKARRVRLAANIYQQGEPMFEFDVGGFDQNKHKPKK